MMLVQGALLAGACGGVLGYAGLGCQTRVCTSSVDAGCHLGQQHSCKLPELESQRCQPWRLAAGVESICALPQFVFIS